MGEESYLIKPSIHIVARILEKKWKRESYEPLEIKAECGCTYVGSNILDRLSATNLVTLLGMPRHATMREAPIYTAVLRVHLLEGTSQLMERLPVSNQTLLTEGTLSKSLSSDTMCVASAFLIDAMWSESDGFSPYLPIVCFIME